MDRTRIARVGLVAAWTLLIALLLAGYLASTPQRTAAGTISMLAWEARYRISPVEDDAQLASIHADAYGRPREQCVACHGDMADSGLLVHRIHLGSELLPGLACPDCHRRVDLSSRGSTNAATWVDVGFCKECHSAFPGLQEDSHMHAEDIDADCTMCHTGDRALRHAQPYLSQIIPSSECKGCHGGRVLPWTPRHERDDWLEAHGTEALGTDSDDCYACHDFGLKFCDECHAQKPPSHIPDEQWLARHPDAARADTRVCYTCHVTDDCKACHVNHEDGWMESHPAFVHERGTSSCTECHSLSACGYCHTEGLGDTAADAPG